MPNRSIESAMYIVCIYIYKRVAARINAHYGYVCSTTSYRAHISKANRHLNESKIDDDEATEKHELMSMRYNV